MSKTTIRCTVACDILRRSGYRVLEPSRPCSWWNSCPHLHGQGLDRLLEEVRLEQVDRRRVPLMSVHGRHRRWPIAAASSGYTNVTTALMMSVEIATASPAKPRMLVAAEILRSTLAMPSAISRSFAAS